MLKHRPKGPSPPPYAQIADEALRVQICVALRELQRLALHTDEMKGVAKMFPKEVYITKVAS